MKQKWFFSDRVCRLQQVLYFSSEVSSNGQNQSCSRPHVLLSVMINLSDWRHWSPAVKWRWEKMPIISGMVVCRKKNIHGQRYESEIGPWTVLSEKIHLQFSLESDHWQATFTHKWRQTVPHSGPQLVKQNSALSSCLYSLADTSSPHPASDIFTELNETTPKLNEKKVFAQT